jgi:alpha-ribazole phosphatase
MEIYLVRHPRPSQTEGLCYGRTDMPVDPDALAAAVASVRSRIPAYIQRRAAIFTSPAPRCLGLARGLAAPREPGVVEELHEMHFGAWEGVPWTSVPRGGGAAWGGEVWSYRPGGGESAAMVAARWRRWATRVAARIAEGDAPVIAVTHAGLIRIALAGAGRLGPELSLDVPFASVHRVELDTVDLGGVDIDASQACTP